MQPGALLLLLAVAAGHVDLALSQQTLNESAVVNISACPFRFYGRSYSLIDVSFEINSTVKYCFKNDPSEAALDCLMVLDSAVDSISVVYNNNTVNGVDILPELSNTTSSCNYEFTIKSKGSTKLTNNFYNLDPQAVFGTSATGPITIDVMVNNATVYTWNLTALITNKDVSGCRTSDGFVLSDSSGVDPDTCSTVYCNMSAFASSVSLCKAMEVCRGNNTCDNAHVVCTVTGSTVIDFFGRVHSVSDRCGYTLVEIKGLKILARFLERRRKDVPLLDHLVIKQQSGDLILRQGGRVQVNDSTIKLTNMTQLIDGVEFSKDHTGVTVQMLSPKVTLFFDGFTAHVSSNDQRLKGLCGSVATPDLNTTLDKQRSSSLDHPACMTEYNDTVDSTINCTRSTEHCNLMRQAPFTACHSHISPEPYITACTNTLCSYPAVDAFSCRALEAYAKACSMKHNIIVGEWRSTAGCSDVPQDFCQDQDCSAHEFCGEMLDKTSCLCRALFASRYKPTNALGEPTVCSGNSATVSLAVCLLLDRGIDHSVLHLKDPSCTGHLDKDNMLTFSFNSSNTCGMEVVTNDSKIIYKNTILGFNSSMSVITRHDQVLLDFSCSYMMPDVRSVSFRIKDSSVVQQIVSGVWNYTLMMNAYTDAGRLNRVLPSTEIQLNQKIWMELKTERLDGDMVSIVTDSCWATSQPLSNSSVRYDLIIKKCANPADRTVRVETNGLGTSSYFSFNMFQFSGESDEVYLHCQVELCPKEGPSCVPSCGGSRKRRSVRSKRADRNPSALITMTWTK